MRMKPLCLALVAFAAHPARADSGCAEPPADAPAVTLVGLDANDDLLLADGRTLRLVGLAPRQDDAETRRLKEAIEPWRGRPLRLAALAGPDRWGRVPARLLAGPAQDGAPPVDLAAMLVAAGAARRLPEPAYAACDAGLRAGGPATPAQAALDGHDIAAIRAQAGRVAVLSGRVASVGVRSQRTYLNFARRRGEAASIVMSRKLWREMQDAGWTTQTLTGKRIAARGVLSGSDGLLLELTARAALDLID